jgi:hypothetical protein
LNNKNKELNKIYSGTSILLLLLLLHFHCFINFFWCNSLFKLSSCLISNSSFAQSPCFKNSRKTTLRTLCICVFDCLYKLIPHAWLQIIHYLSESVDNIHHDRQFLFTCKIFEKFYTPFKDQLRNIVYRSCIK